MLDHMARPTEDHDAQLAERCARGRVVVIDDDLHILDAFCELILLEGYACETYACARSYLQVQDGHRPLYPGPVCVLCDVKMPNMDGLELQSRLNEAGDVPLVLMSGASGAPEAVSAFRAGAVDFLIKPIDAEQLLNTLQRALALSLQRQQDGGRRQALSQLVGSLTAREMDVAQRVAKGMTNLGIALELGITERTVKFHRQRVMEKLGISGTAQLVSLLQEHGSA